MATSVKINDELKNRIQHIAEYQQRTPHWIMCKAIQDYVEREEARENFKQEALASWKNYQETGKHLTGQEVGEWLDTWGTTAETPAPNCHE